MKGNGIQGIPGAMRWLLQAVSGLLLIVLLGVHMIANHYIAAGGLRTYEEVVAYLSHPVVLAWEVIFLIIVIFHAVLGVRSVLYDLGLSPGTQRRLDRLVGLVGIGAVLYGLWLLWAIT